MNIRTAITISILSLMSITLGAQDYGIASPDGHLTMTVHNGERLTFDISMDGRTLITESPMGFCLKGEEDMDGNFCVTGAPAVVSGVEAWKPVVKNRHSDCRVPYRSITLKLREKSGEFRNMGLEIRMMDDAVAFRYTLYGNMNAGMRYITKELTEFSVPAEAALYKSNFAYTDEAHPFKSSQESEFTRTPVNELETGVPVGLPCLIQADAQTWMAITEAHLDNFPAFHVVAGRTEGDRRILHPRLTPLYTEPETELCARFDEEFTSSWRVIMVADSPGRFIESDVIQSLNPPCAIKDPSWVKAGMSAWDHWWSDDIKMEMPVIKQYIDLAAAENWPYMLVDWTWYGPHTRPDAVITRPADNIDMPEIISYAGSKGVKIWLWLRSEDTNNNDAWREAFPLFHQWGVAGVKIDFMDREDQDMVNWYRRIIKACADNQLMVDFHGAYKPDGIERTYPNMMTREGVMGNEYNKWSHRVTPEHNVTLAFTRMIAGPMDYTPGGFRNVTIANHDTSAPASVINTRAAELSKFVIYESPFMVFCDHPDYVLGQSGSDFLNAMPTEWDDTRFIGGLPDEYIAIARRCGSEWYIGVMGNSQARELTLDLSFISEGPMSAEYWQDGRKAAKEPSDIQHGTLKLKSGAPLKVKLAPSGGFVAKVRISN